MDSIRKLRMERGMTQKELAVRSGLQQPNIFRAEQPGYMPKLPTLIKISDALGVKVSTILQEEEKNNDTGYENFDRR